MYIAEFEPTLWPTNLSFKCLLILPTGKTRPAFEALDLPAATLPILEAFPLEAGITAGFGALNPPVAASRDPVRDKAFFSLLFWSLWIGACTGITTGAGLLLSNKLSGILDTASTMVAFAYASLPLLSRVSRILKEGNIVKTWFRYPGVFVIGLLMRSNCKSCLNPLNGFKC